MTHRRDGHKPCAAFFVHCGGPAATNVMNLNDGLFYLRSAGAEVLVWQWNSSTRRATYSYALTTARSSPFWSFTQPYVLYDLEINGSRDVAIYSHNLTSPSKPVSAQLVDLAWIIHD